jgi:hypothetical protein
MTTRNTREELENSVYQYGAEVTRLQARVNELEHLMETFIELGERDGTVPNWMIESMKKVL